MPGEEEGNGGNKQQSNRPGVLVPPCVCRPSCCNHNSLTVLLMLRCNRLVGATVRRNKLQSWGPAVSASPVDRVCVLSLFQ